MKTLSMTGLSLVALLYGCGDSDDAILPTSSASPQLLMSSGEPAPSAFVHFEGSWQGTLTPDDSMTTTAAILFVNGWGEFRLVTDDAQFVGWPRRTDTELTGSVTGIRAAGSTWSDGSRSNIFALNGTFSEADFIEASYSGGGESGVFALSWADEEENKSIGAVFGTWVQYDNGNIVATFQADPDGFLKARVRGNHANGCTFSGVFDAWTSYRSYDVVPFQLSGCPPVAGIDPNGVYSGTAALIDLADDGSDELVLIIALSNDLERQTTFFLNRLPE